MRTQVLSARRKGRGWDSGAGNFEWARTLPFAGDYNQDGRVDLGAFYNDGGDTTRAFLFQSRGTTFAPPSVVWNSGAGTWRWANTLVP